MKETFFELLSLPAQFNLDERALTANYRAAQTKWHPDRFADKPTSEQLHAIQTSADLNDALRTLRDPVLRAVYLLKLRGVDAFDERDTQMAAEFLMQQLLRREQLVEARNDVASLENLLRQIEAERVKRTQRLTLALDVSRDLESARAQTRELRFLQKLVEEIEAAIDSAENGRPIHA